MRVKNWDELHTLLHKSGQMGFEFHIQLPDRDVVCHIVQVRAVEGREDLAAIEAEPEEQVEVVDPDNPPAPPTVQ